MAVLISREVRDGEISATGALSMIPAAGLLLAQATHAPTAEIIILGSKAFMPFKTSRQFHYLAQRGDLGLFFVSGVQIDQYGNYNLHQLGSDRDRPKKRFPGGYGGGMIYYAAKRTILFRTEHSTRSMVEQVDFVSAAGSTPPNISRLGHPWKVLSPIATLAMDRKAERLRLESFHEPHTLNKVRENTGWDLGDCEGVGPTPEPTVEELTTLRGAVRERMVQTGTYADWARDTLRENS